MGRAPCCDKMGLNKGSWTPEEDQILISFIHEHGHANWRALPRLAGLLRCGKSCRLRWINYLRPDIKRGKFTEEEEQIVIKLHQKLGNRWSVIAAKLPGRTDNEIKNVWHTHLKKKLRDDYRSSTTLPQQNTKTTPHIATLKPKLDDFEASPISPQYSSSRMSSTSSDSNEGYSWKNTEEDEILKLENLIGAKKEVRFQFPLFPDGEVEDDYAFISRLEEGFGYWCDLVNKDGELPDLPLF